MTPRKYESRQRAASAEQTRARILEASLALHGTKGFQATSWNDIAKLADVSVGTVYYHFPTIDDLVPACTDYANSVKPLPGPDAIAGVRGRRRRVEAAVRAIFALYDNAPGLTYIVRERHAVPVVDAVGRELEAALRALLREALGRVPDTVARRAEALIDLRVWDSFRSRGISGEVSAKTVAALIDGMLREQSRKQRRGSSD